MSEQSRFTPNDDHRDSRSMMPEFDAITAELLSIENKLRHEKVRAMIKQTYKKFIEHLDPAIPARNLLEHKLTTIESILDPQQESAEANEATTLICEQVKRQVINQAMETFGRDINCYEREFVDYVENYAFYNLLAPIDISPQQAVDKIFIDEAQSEHWHNPNSEQHSSFYQACEILRFKTFLSMIEPYRDSFRQSIEHVWLHKLTTSNEM